MSLDVDRIHRAVAAQLRANIMRDVNVYPWPAAAPVYPAVSIVPDPDYLDYVSTMGGNGRADMRVSIRVEVDALDDESVFVQMARFLSAGDEFGSSIFDAIMVDRTLGGAVENCALLSATWSPDEPQMAVFPLTILVRKEGAQP